MNLVKKILAAIPACVIAAILGIAWNFPNPSYQVEFVCEWILKICAAIVFVQVICFQLKVEEKCLSKKG